MGFRRGGVASPPPRALLAGAGSAGLFALALPPVPLPVLLLPAFLLLAGALRALPRGWDGVQGGAVLGALFAGLHSVLVLHWLPSAGFPHLGWLALPGALAVWGIHAAVGMVVLGAVVVSRAPLAVALIPGWAVLVWLPGAVPWVGVPWPGPESAWVEWPLVGSLLPLAGSTGAGALLAGGAAALLSLGRAGVAAGLLFVLLWAGMEGRVASGIQDPGEGEGHPVTLVELVIPLPSTEDRGEREARVLAAVRRLPGATHPASGLEAWPEAPILRSPGATAPDRYMELLQARAEAVHGSLVAGGHVVRDGRVRNGMLQLRGDGSATLVHEKRRLVPGVERTALLAPGSRGRGLAPGARGAPFPWGGVPTGALICFEVLFPEEVARLRRAGAVLLVQATNDGALHPGAGPFPVVGDAGRRQHEAFLRARAVEFRLPVVRSAIGGPAGGWDPRGRALPETDRRGDGELDLVTVLVPGTGAPPPAAFITPFTGPAAAALLLLLALPTRVPRRWPAAEP
jgi:apolipoprotein N-acyltransferase